MFGWRLSHLGLVFFVICVNKAFNVTWLINDSSRLKDKEGRASWNLISEAEVSSASSEVLKEETWVSGSAGGGSLLKEKAGQAKWNPTGEVRNQVGRESSISKDRIMAGSNRLKGTANRASWNSFNRKKLGINSDSSRRSQEEDQETSRLTVEGGQVLSSAFESHQGDENHGNQIHHKNSSKTILHDGKNNLWKRLQDANTHTRVRKWAQESHSGILMAQESISSGETEAFKTLENKKKMTTSTFALETVTSTDSSAGNTGFTDYTQTTQTTAESTLSKRAIGNMGGQRNEEKGSVSPGVTSALESFPSVKGMKRRKSRKSWEIIGDSGVSSTKVKVDFKVIFPKEK